MALATRLRMTSAWVAMKVRPDRTVSYRWSTDVALLDLDESANDVYGVGDHEIGDAEGPARQDSNGDTLPPTPGDRGQQCDEAGESGIGRCDDVLGIGVARNDLPPLRVREFEADLGLGVRALFRFGIGHLWVKRPLAPPIRVDNTRMVPSK